MIACVLSVLPWDPVRVPAVDPTDNRLEHHCHFDQSTGIQIFVLR